MATVTINDTHLKNIASAIRSKNGTTDTYKPSQMASAIENIESGSGGGTTGKYAPRYISFRGYTGTELDYEIANLDTSNITSTYYMFAETSNLTTSLELSNWNTNKVTDMSYTFYNCKIPSINVSDWDTSNVTNMKYMFRGTTNLDDCALILNNWNTSNVKDMSYMFYDCEAKEINIKDWDTSNVTTMANMFENNDGVTSYDLSGWVGGNVTSMYKMFVSNSKLTRVDLRNFKIKSTTNIKALFNYCSKLQYIDIRSMDFTGMTSSYYDSLVFGGVPTNCLIIVKDDTAKEFVLARRSALTNVKTVAEYEA